ncbi:hypothetical protein [Mucilaginibacter auburnensis]|uniref:Uncharacterized protein n=1 Tax=Mucilaginibacter auburnensis TaxID=1457233 RepID=A0A2H9VMH5_9SPHI|nr:hypothetical protein [Mucilaginibacter auburnensis]PJJ79539.1 hypothetical protein CLV57_2673 [Mucilaginibacter auburnensis]
MKFQLSIQHQNHELVFTVRKAVYFKDLVYQIFIEDQNFILYKRNGVWRSNMNNTNEDLAQEIGAAIAEHCGELNSYITNI